MSFEQAAPKGFIAAIGAALFVLPFAILVLARTDPEYTPLLGGLIVVPMIALGAVILWAFHRIVVRVDPAGFEVAYGTSPFRSRFDWAEVESLETTTLTFWTWGGWGYRGSRRIFKGAAVLMRSGPAVRLELSDGTSLTVSVDDPEAVLAAARAVGGPADG